jgi:hypothetical protein
MNLRDQILGVQDLPQREIVVPEWDGAKIIVRGMTGAERYRMANLGGAGVGTTNVEKFGQAAYSALVWCLLDPATGKPIFEPADRDTLMQRSSAVLEPLIAVMYELSGIGVDAVKAAEKNSLATESENSSSS